MILEGLRNFGGRGLNPPTPGTPLISVSCAACLAHLILLDISMEIAVIILLNV